jgi:hypothetical protein
MSEPGPRGPADEPADAVSGTVDAVSAAEPAEPAEPAAASLAEPADASAEPTEPAGAEPAKGLRGRVVNLRFRLPRTRRGIFALLLVVGAFAFAGIWTSVTLIHWTETADFCGRCHQMGPELVAYESGPHRDVTCGECHVEPGVSGWIKAKMNGTRQLLQVITGTYPQPIPPPDHSALPSVQDTCLKCHSMDRLATGTLVTRTSFAEDVDNTRSFVGLMIRPGSGDIFDVDRSVHWHVLRRVEYRTPDEDAESIDYVAATTLDGTTREFIAQDKIEIAEDVQPEIDAIKAAEKERVMDCIQCHNRTGHPIPNPRRGLDFDMTEKLISTDLEYIKREGMRILWSSYPDEATAFAEIDKLAGFYELEYPETAATMEAEIDEAIAQVKVLYRLTAMPEMKVTAASYPDFMGHLDFPGCFRCHDGGHFLVENGVATKEVIPATCDTCHTYPQIGEAVASLPLGEPPVTHDDPLYVFNHKDVATSVDPGGQSCGMCHARDYCLNCHQTGAVTVDHDTMMTNHAQVIRDQGNTACAYCHQPVYCARCHEQPVLPVTSPFITGLPGTAPAGIRWPLVATGPGAAGQAP